MKWGVRRKANKDGSYTNAGKRRSTIATIGKVGSAVANAGRNSVKSDGYKRSKNPMGTITERSDKPKMPSGTRANAEKQAVKDYSKKVRAAFKASDIANAKWNQVKEQRKKLGKNAVSRFIASAQNKTPEAKAYNKMFEDASRLSDKADAMWLEAQEAYKQTGRTYVSRILNNARYGR